MKVTPEIVTRFEDDQEGYGTKLAISNLLWQVASAVYRDLGITRIKTTYGKNTRVKAKKLPRKTSSNISRNY